MQGFPGIFCYILEVKVTDLVSLREALADNTFFTRIAREMYSEFTCSYVWILLNTVVNLYVGIFQLSQIIIH